MAAQRGIGRVISRATGRASGAVALLASAAGLVPVAAGQCTPDGPVNSYGCDGGEPWTLGNCWFLTRPPLPQESAGLQSAGTVPLAAGGACNDLSLVSGSRVLVLGGGTLSVFGDCIAVTQGGIDLAPDPAFGGTATLSLPNGSTVEGATTFTGTSDGVALAALSEASLGTATVMGGPIGLLGRVSLAGTGLVTAAVINDAALPDEPPAGRDHGVLADIPGRTLSLTGGGTNNAAMEARGGGVLSLSVNAWAQAPGGVIRGRDASTVAVASAVTGGGIEAEAAATVTYAPPASLTGVRLGGAGLHRFGVPAGGPIGASDIIVGDGTPIEVMPGQNLVVIGTLTNGGVITINPTGGPAAAVLGRQFLASVISIDSPGGGIGSGEIVLNAGSEGNLASATLTGNTALGAGQTLRGTGEVGPGTATIDGAAVAGVPGRTLAFESVVANGPVSAENGGAIRLRPNGNAADHQGPGGFSAAEGSRVEVERGAELRDTTLATSGTGVVEFVADGTQDARLFDGVALDGDIRVASGVVVDSFAATLTNHGTLTIGDAGPGASQLRPRNAATRRIDGVGRLVLNATPGGPANDADLFLLSLSTSFVNGPGHTLAGRGRIAGTNSGAFVNEGVISPGPTDDAAGVIEVTAVDLVLGATSELRMSIAGPTPGTGHDAVAAGEAVALGGLLGVAFDAAFAPSVGDRFDLVTAPGSSIFDSISGVFDTVEVRGLTGTLGAVVRVTPAAVTAEVIELDLDDDGTADFFDVLRYLELFDAGDPSAELDGAPGLTAGDARAFLAAFPTGSR